MHSKTLSWKEGREGGREGGEREGEENERTSVGGNLTI